MVTDEFTFPIITTNNVVNQTFLPPLWRISSINNKNNSDHHHDQLQENGRKRMVVFRRSFSEVEAQINRAKDREHDEVRVKAEEEKMDMLWEDFNDDLHMQTVNISPSNSTTSTSATTTCVGSVCESERHCNVHYYGDEFESREEFGGSSSTNVLPRKRKNMDVVVKMLKKLSLLQSVGNKIKKISHA